MTLRPSQVRKWIPIRSKTDNKTHGGRALILAGSSKMPGAAYLAASAAMRIGAGYTYVSLKEILPHIPESIIWDKKSWDKVSAVLIGPGLGTQAAVTSTLKKLRKLSLPVILDADALTLAARKKLYPFPSHWIATPHSGELARFLDITPRKIDSDRVRYVKLAQQKLGCTIVLKGLGTLVADSKSVIKIPTGNVSLAKGGSGDVLSGMIVGLLAQRVPPHEAALLGCYVHGKIADLWIKNKNDYLSMRPLDLIDQLPKVLSKLRK